MKYVEIAKGSPRHQGLSILQSQLGKKITIDTELYRSFFSYDQKIQEHLKLHKSASGYIDNLYLDSLILDIDKGKNTDIFTLHRAKVFVEELINEWKLEEENIQIWFSGTGYHIQIPDIFGFTPSPDLDKTVKATVDAYFPQADTSFYHKAGLIRVGYTINSKSGLYKTPLLLEELNTLTVEQIQALAKTPRMSLRFKKVKIEPLYSQLIQSIVSESKVHTDSVITTPSKVVSCVQKMYSTGEEEGTRHTRIMRMTSAWRRAGVPLKAVVDAMKMYASAMNPYEVEKHVTDTFKAGYSYSCGDEIMKQFCSSSCVFYKNKNYAPNIVSAKEMEKQFVTFARTDFADRAVNLQDIWNLENPFWLYPGFFVELIGDTGLNKTALFQNLVVSLKALTPILYMSTEFGNLLLYRRFCQIAHAMTKDEVYNHYQHNNNTLSNAFQHIHYLKVTPALSEIEKLVASFLPKIVVIDTIDDVPVFDNRGYQLQGVLSENALGMGLKQLAEKYETIILGVHHVRKNSTEHVTKDGDIKNLPLTLNSSKGSGTFVQKADVVLALEGDRKKTIRTLSVLKSRDDMPFRKAFAVNMETFRFEDITSDNYKSALS